VDNRILAGPGCAKARARHRQCRERDRQRRRWRVPTSVRILGCRPSPGGLARSWSAWRLQGFARCSAYLLHSGAGRRDTRLLSGDRPWQVENRNGSRHLRNASGILLVWAVALPFRHRWASRMHRKFRQNRVSFDHHYRVIRAETGDAGFVPRADGALSRHGSGVTWIVRGDPKPGCRDVCATMKCAGGGCSGGLPGGAQRGVQPAHAPFRSPALAADGHLSLGRRRVACTESRSGAP
jgi:hypothetical protein